MIGGYYFWLSSFISIFLGAFLFGLQNVFHYFPSGKVLKLKKAAHFISISAFLYMGILQCDFDHESKENVGKLAILVGLPLFYSCFILA